MLLLSNIFLLILLMYSGLVFYLLIILLLPAGKKTDQGRNYRTLPGVSIVIPFRNEAHNLKNLIASLESQIYQGPYEIMLVNDGSTDGYNMLIDSQRQGRPIKIIHSFFSMDRQLTSKQQALDLGIKEATYDWIVCSDADMLLDQRWLQSLIQPALAGADLVFGHTVIHQEKCYSLFTWFQKFQLETLFTVAYTFNRAGIAGSCMGNNLLISRKAYLETGGFDAMGYSIVEDLDLLATFHRKHLPTATTEPFSATASTFPATTINDYCQQLLRWARGGFRKNLNLSIPGALLAAQNLLLIGALLGVLPGNVSLLACGNLLLTWFFIAAAFRRIKSNENSLLFLPFYALFLIESLCLMAFSVFKKPIVWKNRRIS